VALAAAAARRPGLRRAAARPGAVHRLRPADDRARVAAVGGCAVRRRAGPHRRGAHPGRPGCRPHRGARRLLRRLPHQLGDRAHRAVPLRRHARVALGAHRFPGQHRRRVGLAGLVRRPGGARGLLSRVVAVDLRRRDQHPHPGHPRRARLPGASRGGAAAVDRPAVPRRGSSSRATPGSGTTRCSAGWTGTCSPPTGAAPHWPDLRPRAGEGPRRRRGRPRRR